MALTAAGSKLSSIVMGLVFAGSIVVHEARSAHAQSDDWAPDLSSWLPASRQLEWRNAGIPGGVPTILPGANVVDFGAIPNDGKDDWQAFQNAIKAVRHKKNNAVLIPAGQYILAKTLTIDGSVVLRGAGAEHTTLVLTMKGNGIEVSKGKFGPWVELVRSAPFKAKSLTLKDSDSFAAGDFIEIQQQNDKRIMYTSAKWNVRWAQKAVGQLTTIEKVVDDTLMLSDPTNIAFKSELSAQVRRANLIPWVGIEDLHITRRSLHKDSSFSIFLKNTAYSWVTRVHSDQADSNHIGAHRSYKCELRDSYLHDSSNLGTGGNGYGVKLGYHVTGCLVENNVFHSLRHSMLLHLGANGNVLGYNYSYNSKNQAGKTLPDISIHGHYPFANLFEGNVVEEIGFADHWGPAGPLNTAFRNCVTKEGIWLKDHSSSQTLISNRVSDTPESFIGYADDSVIENTLALANEPIGRVRLKQVVSEKHGATESSGIGASLYSHNKPDFYGSVRWPSTGSEAIENCTNPAMQRHKSRQR